MLKLLPNRFKKIGAISAPLGFTLWLVMQYGGIIKLSEFLGLDDTLFLNPVVGVISFFSFLFGIYAMTFSSEKVEDEMIGRVRLESFQFSALMQLLYIIAGFILFAIFGDPSEAGLMLFFVVALFLFWMVYIIRFNYIIHIGAFKNEKLR